MSWLKQLFRSSPQEPRISVQPPKAKRDVDALVDATSQDDWSVGSDAFAEILELDSELSGRALVAVLDTCRQPSWRAKAAKALGGRRLAHAVDPLLHAMLGDADPLVRRQAAWALEELTWTPTSIEEKVASCVARQCWDECVAIGPAAVDSLLVALEKGELSSFGSPAEALGKIADPRALTGLLDRLTYKTEEGDQVDSSVAKALIKCGAIGDQRAVERLVPLLRGSDSWATRSTAAEYLGLLGHALAIEPLIDALNDANASVAKASAAALRLLSDQATVDEEGRSRIASVDDEIKRAGSRVHTMAIGNWYAE